METPFDFDISTDGKIKEERTPNEVLTGFIETMNKWEIACSEADSDDLSNYQLYIDKRTECVNKIYEEYCTKRKHGKGRLSFRKPPEYDPNLEVINEIEEKSNRRLEIYTKSDDGDSQYRYVLLKEHSAWLIDNKKRLIEDKYEVWEL